MLSFLPPGHGARGGAHGGSVDARRTVQVELAPVPLLLALVGTVYPFTSTIRLRCIAFCFHNQATMHTLLLPQSGCNACPFASTIRLQCMPICFHNQAALHTLASSVWWQHSHPPFCRLCLKGTPINPTHACATSPTSPSTTAVIHSLTHACPLSAACLHDAPPGQSGPPLRASSFARPCSQDLPSKHHTPKHVPNHPFCAPEPAARLAQRLHGSRKQRQPTEYSPSTNQPAPITACTQLGSHCRQLGLRKVRKCIK